MPSRMATPSDKFFTRDSRKLVYSVQWRDQLYVTLNQRLWVNDVKMCYNGFRIFDGWNCQRVLQSYGQSPSGGLVDTGKQSDRWHNRRAETKEFWLGRSLRARRHRVRPNLDRERYHVMAGSLCWREPTDSGWEFQYVPSVKDLIEAP